jgi:uncharacterized protein YraI
MLQRRIRQLLLAWVVIFVVVMAWYLLGQLSRVDATAICPATPLSFTLTSSPPAQYGNQTRCFTISVPASNQEFTVTLYPLDNGGQYDFYISAGDQTMLYDKYNLRPVNASTRSNSFKIISRQNRYTIAIVPVGATNATSQYNLSAYDTSPVAQDDTCTGDQCLGTIPGGGSLGASESIESTFVASCAGKTLIIRAFWSGRKNVELALYGPNGSLVARQTLGTPVAQYEWKSAVRYRIRAQDLQAGARWWAVVNNTSGEDMSYPEITVPDDDPSCPIPTATPTRPPNTPTPISTPTPIPASSPTPASAQRGRVADGPLNVRSGPGSNYARVGSLPTGTEVQIVGISADGAWYQIDGGNWVAAAYVVLIDSTPQQTSYISFQQGRLPTSAYNGASDVTLEQQEPTYNYSNVAECYVDGDNPPHSTLDRVLLLKWDVSTLPPGSTVKSAWLTLNVTNETAHTYYAYGMSRSWREEQATWQQAENGLRWNQDGAAGNGDRSTTIIGAIGPAQSGVQYLVFNANGVALLQGWIDGTIANNGMSIVNSSATDGIDFTCSEADTTSLRPALTIEYIGR